MVSELITDNGSPITNSYIWGLDLSGSLQGAGGIGGLLAATKGTNIYFATYDGNGNVSEYLSAEGEIVAHYEYDPFGNQLVADGELAHEFLHRFSTKPYEENTALVLYEYRPYSSSLGRFITEDPLGEAGGIMLYNFVSGNPAGLIDYLGTRIWVLMGDEKESYADYLNRADIAEGENTLVLDLLEELRKIPVGQEDKYRYLWDGKEVGYYEFEGYLVWEQITVELTPFEYPKAEDAIVRAKLREHMYPHDVTVYQHHTIKTRIQPSGPEMYAVEYKKALIPATQVHALFRSINAPQGKFLYVTCFQDGRSEEDFIIHQFTDKDIGVSHEQRPCTFWAKPHKVEKAIP